MRSTPSKRSSWYKDFKQFRQSSYEFNKKWFEDENISFFKLLKCRKTSIFKQIKERPYDDYMIEGLCYGNYYGFEKISKKRFKYIRILRNCKIKGFKC